MGNGPTVVADDARSDDDSPACRVDIARWHDLAVAVLRTEGAAGELTLTFIDRDEIAELNEQYMAKSGPTDVLSFPLDDTPDEMPTGIPGSDAGGDGADVPILLGDIVISPAVADAQFAEHAGTYDDELALLVVHGVLHILGHDHVDDDEAELMHARELALLTEHHWSGDPAPAAFRQLHTDD